MVQFDGSLQTLSIALWIGNERENAMYWYTRNVNKRNSSRLCVCFSVRFHCDRKVSHFANNEIKTLDRTSASMHSPVALVLGVPIPPHSFSSKCLFLMLNLWWSSQSNGIHPAILDLIGLISSPFSIFGRKRGEKNCKHKYTQTSSNWATKKSLKKFMETLSLRSLCVWMNGKINSYEYWEAFCVDPTKNILEIEMDWISSSKQLERNGSARTRD